jgi:hypothetical protein
MPRSTITSFWAASRKIMAPVIGTAHRSLNSVTDSLIRVRTAVGVVFLCRLQGKQTRFVCVMCAAALAPQFELCSQAGGVELATSDHPSIGRVPA